MTRRGSRSSGINWKSVGMGLFLFVVIAASFIVITGNNPFAANTAPDTPDQQVKVKFNIVDASSGNAITSGNVRLWKVENGLYVNPESLTIASDGSVTSSRLYNYGDVIALQYKDHDVGTSMVYYTTPIQQFTVEFSAAADQGSAVYIGDIEVKKISTSVTSAFQDADLNTIVSGDANYSTSDTGITVVLKGLSDDTYFGGEDFIDYFSSTHPQYEGGIFILIKTGAEQHFADNPNLIAYDYVGGYYIYLYKFDQIHKVGTTTLVQTYTFSTIDGATLVAGSLSISIYDYYHVIGTGYSISNLVASRSVSGWTGYIE